MGVVARFAENRSFKAPRSAPISVAERMQCHKIEVGPERLFHGGESSDLRRVQTIDKFCHQLSERRTTGGTSMIAAEFRRPGSHVVT